MKRAAEQRLYAGIFVCLVLSAVLTGAARATTFGDIEVTLQSNPLGNSSHGYFEYVFLVANHSTERPYSVTLSMPHQRGYAGTDHLRDVRRTVQVGASETVRVALLQPDQPHVGGEDVSVFIDDRRQEHSVPLRPNATQTNTHIAYGGVYHSWMYSTGPLQLLILKSRGISKDIPRLSPAPPPGAMGMAGMPGGMGGMPPAPIVAPGAIGPGGGAPPARPPAARPPGMRRPVAPQKPRPGIPAHAQVFVAEPVEIWSPNWLAYSRYDGILVTGDEVKAMTPAVRTALWQYVETGGTLLIAGEADLRGLSVTATREVEDGWRVMDSGFGHCIVSPEEDIDNWKESHFQLLSNSWSETPKPWEGVRGTYDANEKFPVVEDIGIPTKGLFVLMFLFAVAIGPINFLVLARKKRRIWVLWTTPAISLLTCLAVFGYMLLSEGWEGHLRTEALTLLDQNTHRATTLGWTAVYSPLTPSEGLHFRYETEVIPQRVNEGRKAGIRSCTIDWSRDQHFASGWVEARVPAHFKIRKSEPRRERVNIHQGANGKIEMVNGLGAEIRRFTYADDKGNIHVAENIGPGARVSLTEKNLIPAPVQPMRQLYVSSNWLIGKHVLASDPQRYLGPRSYLAEVDDSPFVEDALRNAGSRKCRALIVGYVNPGDESK